jgi:hypothetical protein
MGDFRMSDSRKEFEALDEVQQGLRYCNYNESTNYYHADVPHDETHEWHTQFVNGAWYAFQEQQKKIDALELKNKSIDHSSKECLGAMSLSRANYLKDGEKLKCVILELNKYLQGLSEKHMSTHGYLGVLDILEKHKELLK